jgi:hypothetical protein
MTATEESMERDEKVALMVRERGLEPWVAAAIIDAGLPMRLGGIGFSGPETKVLDAEKDRRHARAARAKVTGEQGEAQTLSSAPPPPRERAPRATYSDEVREAARRARALLDGKGAPGPKQVALTMRAIEQTGNPALAAAIVAQQREGLLAFGVKGKPADGLLTPELIKLMDDLAVLCDGDPFCKGRRLAVQLVAIHDQEGSS